MLSELTTRNDSSVYHAYKPVSKTLPESYTIVRCRREENQIRVQEKMANSMLHHHSSHIWVYVKHSTLSDLFCPHNSTRGWYCQLPCKTKKTEVHRDRILFPLLYLTILYCLPGENYSVMDELTKSSQSIYRPCNSQSATVSQKVLQGDNHL